MTPWQAWAVPVEGRIPPRDSRMSSFLLGRRRYRKRLSRHLETTFQPIRRGSVFSQRRSWNANGRYLKLGRPVPVRRGGLQNRRHRPSPGSAPTTSRITSGVQEGTMSKLSPGLFINPPEMGPTFSIIGANGVQAQGRRPLPKRCCFSRRRWPRSPRAGHVDRDLVASCHPSSAQPDRESAAELASAMKARDQARLPNRSARSSTPCSRLGFAALKHQANPKSRQASGKRCAP